MIARRREFLLIIAVVTTATAPVSAGVNLVKNPGFETGSFNDWTLVSPFGFSTVDDNQYAPLGPHTGTYYAFLADLDLGSGSLSQTIATVVGRQYRFSFWLEVSSNGAPPDNSFSASWENGPALLTIVDAKDHGYVRFSFDVVSTTNRSVIMFYNFNNPWGWGLDDVSLEEIGIVGVPEPGTTAAACVGAVVALGATIRRRRLLRVG